MRGLRQRENTVQDPKLLGSGRRRERVFYSNGHWTRFGAEVRLYDASGKILGTRQVSTGGGYNSQSAIPLHFGLAKLEPVTVEVTFMSKQGRRTQTIKNVNPANFYGKTLVIREM